MKGLNRAKEKLHEMLLFSQEKHAVVAAGTIDLEREFSKVLDEEISDEQAELHIAEILARIEQSVARLDDHDLQGKVVEQYVTQMETVLGSFMRKLVENKSHEDHLLKRFLLFDEKIAYIIRHAEEECLKLDKYAKKMDKVLRKLETAAIGELESEVSHRLHELHSTIDDAEGQERADLERERDALTKVEDHLESLKSFDVRLLRKLKEDLNAQIEAVKVLQKEPVEALPKDFEAFCKRFIHYLDHELEMFLMNMKKAKNVESKITLLSSVTSSFFKVLVDFYESVKEKVDKNVFDQVEALVKDTETAASIEHKSRHLAKLLMRFDQASAQLEKMWEIFEKGKDPKIVHGFERLEKVEAKEFKVAKLEKREAAFLETVYGKAHHELIELGNKIEEHMKFLDKQTRFYSNLGENSRRTLDHLIHVMTEHNVQTYEAVSKAASKAEAKLRRARMEGARAH